MRREGEVTAGFPSIDFPKVEIEGNRGGETHHEGQVYPMSLFHVILTIQVLKMPEYICKSVHGIPTQVG